MNDTIFKEQFLYFARRHSRLSPPEVPAGRKPTVDELASNVAFIEFVERYVTKHNGKTDTQKMYIAGAKIVERKGIRAMTKRYPNPYKLLEKVAAKKPKRFTDKTLVLLWLLALQDLEEFFKHILFLDAVFQEAAKENTPKDKRKIN